MMDDRSSLQGAASIQGAAGALALFVGIAVAGGVTAFAAVEDYARARASAGWRQVEGVILSNSGDRDGLRYSWFDGAETHTGERRRFWTASFAASGVVYQPGDRPTVYVKPDDGRIAVLEPGGNALFFGGVLITGGLLVFIGFAGVIQLAMRFDGLAPLSEHRDIGLIPSE